MTAKVIQSRTGREMIREIVLFYKIPTLKVQRTVADQFLTEAMIFANKLKKPAHLRYHCGSKH